MIHSKEQVKQKIDGLRTYLKMNFGQPLTQDKIDQCNQFITEIEREFTTTTNKEKNDGMD